MNEKHKIGALLCLTTVLFLITVCLPRIPQDPAYHRFAGLRTLQPAL